jgi:hypothetical protein
VSLCFFHPSHQFSWKRFFKKASSFQARNKGRTKKQVTIETKKQKRNKLHATLYDSQQLKQSCVFVLVLKKTMKIEKVNTLFLIFMILTFVVSLPFVQSSSSSEFSTKSLLVSCFYFVYY